MTSHDVVNRLRKILHERRIGHSGTLDPQARGVLLVLIGKACKILPFLADTDKEYIAQLQLGKRTLSDDIWGEVLEEREIRRKGFHGAAVRPADVLPFSGQELPGGGHSYRNGLPGHGFFTGGCVLRTMGHRSAPLSITDL